MMENENANERNLETTSTSNQKPMGFMGFWSKSMRLKLSVQSPYSQTLTALIFFSNQPLLLVPRRATGLDT